MLEYNAREIVSIKRAEGKVSMLCVKPFAKGRLRLFSLAIASIVMFAGHAQAEDNQIKPVINETPLVQSMQIVCSSQPDHTRSICPLPVNPEQVALVSNMSQTPCVFGRNWGLEGEILWTANGCAARFSVTYGRAQQIRPQPVQPEDQFLTPEPRSEPFRREA
jgi:DUF3011 family protein